MLPTAARRLGLRNVRCGRRARRELPWPPRNPAYARTIIPTTGSGSVAANVCAEALVSADFPAIIYATIFMAHGRLLVLYVVSPRVRMCSHGQARRPESRSVNGLTDQHYRRSLGRGDDTCCASSIRRSAEVTVARRSPADSRSLPRICERGRHCGWSGCCYGVTRGLTAVPFRHSAGNRPQLRWQGTIARHAERYPLARPEEKLAKGSVTLRADHSMQQPSSQAALDWHFHSETRSGDRQSNRQVLAHVPTGKPLKSKLDALPPKMPTRVQNRGLQEITSQSCQARGKLFQETFRVFW